LTTTAEPTLWAVGAGIRVEDRGVPQNNESGQTIRKCSPSVRFDGLEFEAGHVPENVVIGDERYPKTDCRGGDPAIGIMFPLGQGVSDSSTVNA
jgi:hypothetical protein